MSPKAQGMQVHSIATYIPISRVRAELINLGFNPVSEATMVSDGKFWKKSLYRLGQESAAVLDEVGEVTYLRDPVVTVFGKGETVEKIASFLTSTHA